jgi:hypothetical protein
MTAEIRVLLASDVGADTVRAEIWSGRTLLMDVWGDVVTLFDGRGIELRLDALVEALAHARRLQASPRDATGPGPAGSS